MACNPSKIISALHEEKQNITDIVRHDIKVSDRMVLRKIPDGGVVARDSNQETIVYGEGRQAAMAYRTMDHDPRDLESGQMTGRDTAGRSTLFDTSINDVDDNACHGFCTIDFAQGFRKRGFTDYGIDVDTPVKCTRELDRHGKPHLRGYFEGFRRHFTKFGLDNFSDNLLNLVIQNGEANASVLGADQFNVTTGGWQAPPEHRITIHFLEEYRDHIMAEMEMLAMPVPENWKLEVEMPVDDWLDAIKEHQVQRNGLLNGGTPMASVDVKMLEDPEHPMRGREFHDFGRGIRCFFNERPIRGFFRQVGTSGGNPIHEFTRVYHWKNSPGEEGGLVLVPNHDYREDTIEVNGVEHEMVTIIPHIHSQAFQRYRLQKPVKPDGSANMGVNYEVKVADGPYIANNIQNDKFQLAARHEFRFKVMYPELAGFIAYRHGRRAGYTLDVVPRANNAGPDEFSSPELYRECDLIDDVTTANCAVCTEVPTSEGDCIASGSAANGTVNLDPGGTVNTVHEDDADPKTVTLTVRRTGELAKAGSVDYATADGSGDPAVAGTNYTAASGTLNFAAGEEFQLIEVAIIDGSGSATKLNFTVTLSNASGVDLGTSTVTTIEIEDLSF